MGDCEGEKAHVFMVRSETSLPFEMSKGDWLGEGKVFIEVCSNETLVCRWTDVRCWI